MPRKKGFWREKLHPRTDSRERFLKPIKRKTKVKGKEYVHYVILTSVPEKWKDGVKVTIEPLPPIVKKLGLKAYRESQRDLREMGLSFTEMVEKHLDEEAERASATEESKVRLKKIEAEKKRLAQLSEEERAKEEAEQKRKEQEERDKLFESFEKMTEEQLAELPNSRELVPKKKRKRTRSK